MKIKFLVFLVGLVLMTSCDFSNSGGRHGHSWGYIKSRIIAMNGQFERANIPVDNFTSEDKEKLMNVSEEELEELLQQMHDQLSKSHNQAEKVSNDMREKAEAFLNIVDPLLAAAENQEEYHRIVLEYKEYCDTGMVAQSKEWIMLNVAKEDWGDLGE